MCQAMYSTLAIIFIFIGLNLIIVKSLTQISQSNKIKIPERLL